MAPKKSGGSNAAGLETKDELKAVLLADSYGQAFSPVTLEVPKALLPLVNVPMMDYALEWLAASRVEEVFVVCCAHAAQIKKHIADSKWSSQKSFKVTVVVSRSSTSLGDALRAIDSRGCIASDFVLLSADTVTNLDLQRPLKEHKARREKDRNAIMTLVAKQVVGPSARLRLGCKPLLLAVDPASQRLLKYQALESRSRPVKVDAHFFGERDSVQLRTDLLDCQIQICAPEVLMLFTDNFDYQDLRQHFIPGVLSEEELGNKLYLHTLSQEYAAKVGNARAYDAVSRDLVQRWCFPFVPDTNLLPLHGPHGQASYRYHRNNTYREQGVVVARDAKLLHDAAVGAGTHIDQSAVVVSSVIGRGCRIGKGAHIEGSYLHDNVTVWEGARVESAMLCQGVTVMPKAHIREGVIVSFKAVIGHGQTVGRNQRITLCRQAHHGSDSEDDDRRLGSQGGESSTFGSVDNEPAYQGEQPSQAHVSDAAAAAAGNSLPNATGFDEGAVGKGGAGFLWEQNLDQREAALTSLAQPAFDDEDDGNSSDEASIATVEDMASDAVDPPEGAAEMMFKQEVTETVLRCVRDRHNLDNAIVELNSLKLAENRTFADVARYVLSTLLSLCLQAPARVEGEYRDLYPAAMPATDKELVGRLEAVVKAYGRLLRQYLKGSEEQVDILLTLEEFCSEEAPFGPASHGKRFVPVFARVLQLLYDADFIAEESFLEWAEEKQNGEEDEKVFLKKAEPFLEWLREADEESDDETE